MKIKINFETIYIYIILFLVLGISSISALNYIYELQINSVYNTILSILIILSSIGVFFKKIKLSSNNYLRYFFVFFIITTFSIVLLNSGDIGERKYFLFLGSGLLLTFFSSSIKPSTYYYLPNAFVFYALVNVLVIFGYFLVFKDISELRWFMNEEIGADVIYMSRAIGLGIVVLFFYFKNKLFKICFIAVFLFCMKILEEVGPFLALLIVIFAFYFRKNGLYLFLSIVGGMLFYFFVIQEFVYDLTVEAISNDGRVEIYTRNFNYFIDNPLFGIGIAGSADIINHYQSAHNIFLEIAAELGILGLIPFVIMVILLIKKFFVNKDFLFGYLWLYSFIVVQFSGDIGLNSLFWFFSAILMSAPIKKRHYASDSIMNLAKEHN